MATTLPKNKAPEPIEPDPVSEWHEYEKDPATQWIEYREAIHSSVDVPGVGLTSVRDYIVHRVPLPEWPAYEQTLNESKKGQ